MVLSIVLGRSSDCYKVQATLRVNDAVTIKFLRKIALSHRHH